MKFINREYEINYIKECIKLSSTKLFSIYITGQRRIGKSRLIFEIIKEKDLYFFVNKDKTSNMLLKEYEEILKEKNIITELEILQNWDNFFNIIFNKYKGIVVFDEFQNFLYLDPLIYGVFQKYIDLNENKKGLLFVFMGSIVGLLKKIFEDKKEPLFGRIKRKLILKEMNLENILKFCDTLKINDIEETFSLYAILGGFPKYYVSIEDEGLQAKDFYDIIDKFFFYENATLEDEVINILSMEFGKRKGFYYDILTAIANGSKRVSEISSYLNKKETAFSRHLNELINYFQIIGYETQVFGQKRLLYIKHPLIFFWFKIFQKNISLYKQRKSNMIEKLKNEINSFIGIRFEEICREFLEYLNMSGKVLPFQFEIIGKQWGKFSGEKGKNSYEIDIVAVNKEQKNVLFGESKWADNIDAEQELKYLFTKANYIDWEKENRKEHFVIFAKSFKKKIKNAICYDLKDINKLLKKT